MSYNNPLSVVEQYFTNIAAIQNVVVLQQNLTLRNHWEYVTDVLEYHNAGKWSMDYKILCFMLKNI